MLNNGNGLWSVDQDDWYQMKDEGPAQPICSISTQMLDRFAWIINVLEIQIWTMGHFHIRTDTYKN
jgi:hypothetical protein